MKRRKRRYSSSPDSANTVPIEKAALACNDGKELPPARQSLGLNVELGGALSAANLSPSTVMELKIPASIMV
jgi:hypothetical protein